MTVVNSPIAWQPESTDATMIATAAVTEGDVVLLTTNFPETQIPSREIKARRKLLGQRTKPWRSICR